MSIFDQRSFPRIVAFIAACAVALIVLAPVADFTMALIKTVPVDDADIGDKFDQKFMKLADLTYHGIWASVRSATEYHITTTGSGTACSLASPCSFTTGVDKGIGPDDIMWIHAGDYKLVDSHSYLFRGKGTPGHNAVYRNYQNGKVTIDQNVLNTSGCLLCDQPEATEGNLNGTYHTIWGLVFYNSNNNESRTSTTSNFEPPHMHQPLFRTRGSKVINCFSFDANNGNMVTAGNSGANGGGLLYRGNFRQYAGFVDYFPPNYLRGAGHSLYVENLTDGIPGYPDPEVLRDVFEGEIGLRAFDVGHQDFGTTAGTQRITTKNTIEAANGICLGAACNDVASWPAISCCANTFYFGTQGGVSTSCTSSIKTWLNGIVDGNWSIGSGFTVGSTKGSCNATLTNNYFFTLNGQNFTCDKSAACPNPATGCGTWGTPTVSGNTFYAPLNGGGCPAPPVTLANYPNNTVNSGYPASGSVTKSWPSPDEAGRGWYAVANFDSSKPTNVTIDLDAMGGYAGEQYRVQNWQDLDPWDATKDIATGVCAATCGTLSVPASAASIRQPAFTRMDNVTPFPKPPDLWANSAPRYVVFYLYPRWDVGAGTPTPTNTFTPTSTFTLTPSQTPTQTPTLTPTQTTTATNTPTLTPSQTVTNTPTFTPTKTPTVTVTPQVNTRSFGVNTCQATAPMSVTASAGTVSGYYASSTTPNQGLLTCNFSVPATGLYRTWVHVSAQSNTADSFFLDMDGDGSPNCVTDGNTTCTAIFDVAERSQPCTSAPPAPNPCNYSTQGWPTDGFIWNMLNSRNATCGSCSGTWTEKDYTLAAGNHTLKFRAREATGGESARLDWIILTTDMNYDPDFPVPSPTPTSTPINTNVCRKVVRCNQKQGVVLVPCDKLGAKVSPCPWSK